MEWKSWTSLIIIFLGCLWSSQTLGQTERVVDDGMTEPTDLAPPVMVAFLVRNKAHILPYFLRYLEKLNYPKKRIVLWIRADHNTDDSVNVLNQWLKRVRDDYHAVDIRIDSTETAYSDESGPCDWSPQRFTQMIKLRQDALDTARHIWADYILFVDCDNVLVNGNVLKDLMAEERTVIAPLLNATASSHYANFWGDMDEKGYYRRSEDYKEIQQRHKQGCFAVPMVHSTVLINLRRAESVNLSYNGPPGYQGPHDDIIQFAFSAKHYGIPMHLLNRDRYGYMQIPMQDHNTLENEMQQLAHMKMENIVFDTPLEHLSYIKERERPLDLMGFDQIYMINLKRRPDRRHKMMECFKLLGIQAKILDAVDGKLLNDTYLKDIGVRMLPGYADPYHGRALTMGEIGCFLSHFVIWNEILEKNYKKVLVFEDDIRFHTYFREKMDYILNEIEEVGIEWDLVYLGRKSLDIENESWVEGSQTLVWPEYTYWTLSYMLTFEGARKLIQQDPLSKLIPVDEYLPIMFDKHPQTKWAENFWPRDLVTLSAWPLLVEPTHYTGEPGYFTDTEQSEVIGKKQKGDPGDLDEILKDEL